MRGQSAVNRHRVAGHEGGRIGAQPGRSFGDLFGAAVASDRHDAGGLRHPRMLRHNPLRHRRVHDPGTHAVDPDSRPGILQRRRAGQSDHAVLGRRVSRHPVRSHQSRRRRGVDDRAAFALPQHLQDLVLHAQPRALRSISTTRSKFSSVSSAVRASLPMMPALLNAQSILPNVFTAAATIASTSAALAMSQRTKTALPPPSRIDLTTASPSSAVTSTATTAAPSRAKTDAAALPIPDATPVMIATLSFSEPAIANPLEDVVAAPLCAPDACVFYHAAAR